MRHKFNIVTYTNQSCAFVLYHSHASCHWVSSCQACCVSQQMNDTEQDVHFFLCHMCIFLYESIHPVFLTNPSATHSYCSWSEVTLDPYRISYACHACLPIVCFVQETGYSHGERADQLTTALPSFQSKVHQRYDCGVRSLLPMCCPNNNSNTSFWPAQHSCWHVNTSTPSWHSVSTSQVKDMRVNGEAISTQINERCFGLME